LERNSSSTFHIKKSSKKQRTMEKTEILVKVQDIFRDVLDNEEIVLNNDTSADDIEPYPAYCSH